MRIRPGEHFEIVNPQDDPRYKDYWTSYHAIMERKGVSPDYARTVLRTNNTVIAALGVRKGHADAMLCGTVGRYQIHLRHLLDVIGAGQQHRMVAALNLLISSGGIDFLCDAYVTPDPTAEEIVETTLMAAEEVRRIRHRAQGCAALPFEFRQQRHAVGPQDARGAEAAARARTHT